MSYASNRELRAKAREQLGNSIFGQNWLMALLVLLIASAIVSFGSAFVIVGLLLEGVLMVGVSGIFLSLKRKGGEIEITDLFSGTKQLADNMLLGLMHYVFVFLWSLLFVIPGIVKGYSYSMCYYIKNDHPEYTWRECIDASRKMMRGHKWRLFTLHFSFIGWYIVGSLAFGIGTLWVNPYLRAAEANFYEDLLEKTFAEA